jgi:hypothetical protein
MSQDPGAPGQDPGRPEDEASAPEPMPWRVPGSTSGDEASDTQSWQSPPTRPWPTPPPPQGPPPWQGGPPPQAAPPWQGGPPPQAAPPWQGGPPPQAPPPWQAGMPPPWQAGLPQQQWHHLPPEELIRLHKPGVIPLRPLKLSDIFEGALTTMRRNPEATIGMAVLVLAVFLVPSMLISLGTRWVTSLAVEDWAVLGVLLPGLAGTVATLALSGFIIYVVSEAALGDRVGIGQTWRAVRGRLLALVGVTLLTGLVVVGAVGVVVLVIVLAVAALGDGAIILAMLLVLAMLPLLLWLSAKVALGPAAVVLERAGPGRGLARSWALTRGGQAWRVLGILLLAALLTGIFSSVISLPISAVVQVLVGAVTDDVGAQLTGVVVIEHVVQLVVNAIVTPFSAGVTALLYLDQRIRREGLDVTMIRAAQERAAARRA